MSRGLLPTSSVILAGIFACVLAQDGDARARRPRVATARPGPVTRAPVPRPNETLEHLRARYAFFKNGREMWGNGVGRKIALTFDDGPSYRTTPRLLDHLDAFGVKATFFVNSKNFNRYGLLSSKSYAALVEVHRRGHLIGNHTYAHPLLTAIPAAKQRRQIEHTERAIQEITGVPTYLFRPPFGALSHYAKKLLRKLGTTVVMWNIGSDDDKNFNVSKVVNTLMRKLDMLGGGIVLLHDTHYWSVEAVPYFLKAVRIEGCRQLARGEEPYDVVGLEYFYRPRKGQRQPDPEAQAAWMKRRAALVRRCQTPARGPLPDFLRGE